MADFVTSFYRLNYDQGFDLLNLSPTEVKYRILEDFSAAMEKVVVGVFENLESNEGLKLKTNFTHSFVPQYTVSIGDEKTKEEHIFMNIAAYERITGVSDGVPIGHCDMELKIFMKRGFADFLLEQIRDSISDKFPHFEEIDKGAFYSR